MIFDMTKQTQEEARQRLDRHALMMTLKRVIEHAREKKMEAELRAVTKVRDDILADWRRVDYVTIADIAGEPEIYINC